MTTSARQRTTPRWALSFLAAIVAVLAIVFAAATASAATQGVAETRVGASDVPATVAVGPPERIAAGQRLGNEPARVVVVVATGVAAKSATSPVGRKVVTKEFEDGVTTRYGWEMPVAPGTNAAGVIGGRAYSGHALDQMQSRGFVPSVVEDTIGLGVSAQSRGATVYYGSANNVSVVLNSNGRVITVSYGDLRP